MGILDNIQANVLKPHDRNCCLFLFFIWDEKVSEKKHYKAWVKAAGSFVTSHQQQLADTLAYKLRGQQSAVINFGLTYQAFELMGSELATTFQQEKEFVDTVDGSSFYQPSYPENKEGEYTVFHPGIHHAALYIAHDDEQLLYQKQNEILAKLSELKLLVRVKPFWVKQKRKPAEKGKKGRAAGPLGFEDDISTVSQEEEILEHAFGFKKNNPENKRYLGTFMMVQKILLNQAAFDKHAAALAETFNTKTPDPVSIELAKAYMIGRFRNGTPLVCSNEASAKIRDEENSFDYQNDKAGLRCPFHAHIRSANPRKDGKSVPIVRRSIVFDEIRAEKKEEAMLFISFQSSAKENLRPIYQRMLSVTEDGHPDALFYPHKEGQRPWLYHPVYGLETAERIAYKRPAGDITTIGSGALYFCPSKAYLDNPE
ncbi:MAG: hypothetical protein AAGJ93_05650 [Bacteroidota bacterium]